MIIWRNKVLKKKKIKTVLILTVVFSIVCYLYSNAVYLVTKSAEASFSSYTTTAFYTALGEVFAESEADELVSTVYGEDGSVVYVGTDALKVNALAASIAKKTFEYYNEFVNGGVEVYAGAFSGIKLLSGAGDRVKVNVLTVSGVRCEFRTEYISLGINQTVRNLYITIEPSYSIVMPFYRKEKVFAIDYLVYDDLIVGDIPQFYLTGTT